MTNPFLQLKSRYFVFGAFFLVSLLVGMVYGVLVATPLLPWPAEDPIATPILTLLTFGLLAGVLVWAGQKLGLQFKYLFGKPPNGVSWWYFVLLVFSGLLFSMGSFLWCFTRSPYWRPVSFQICCPSRCSKPTRSCPRPING